MFGHFSLNHHKARQKSQAMKHIRPNQSLWTFQKTLYEPENIRIAIQTSPKENAMLLEAQSYQLFYSRLLQSLGSNFERFMERLELEYNPSTAMYQPHFFPSKPSRVTTKTLQSLFKTKSFPGGYGPKQKIPPKKPLVKAKNQQKP